MAAQNGEYMSKLQLLLAGTRECGVGAAFSRAHHSKLAMQVFERQI
jgi:hypothetical protein